MYILASSSSKLYNKLLGENLINESFGYEYAEGPHYAAVLFGGESRNPKRAANIIKNAIREMKKEGIDREEFELAKRAVYGNTISEFNRNDNIANSMIDMHFNDRELFEYVSAIANAGIEDIEQRLTEMIDPENCTLSVVCGEDVPDDE